MSSLANRFIIEGGGGFRNDRIYARSSAFGATAQDQGDNIFSARLISSPPERLTNPEKRSTPEHLTPGNPEIINSCTMIKYTQCNDSEAKSQKISILPSVKAS